jgi:hypothetical protein
MSYCPQKSKATQFWVAVRRTLLEGYTQGLPPPVVELDEVDVDMDNVFFMSST